MEIKLADFSHKPELLEIWREVFGDDEDFILSFLDAYLIPEYNVPLVIADGKIVSVLYLVELELYADMKAIGNCAYLFAAATREEYRGLGYMGALIKYAAELYKNRGIAAIFLFPQESDEKLINYYAKFGFKSVYQMKKICAQKRGNINLKDFRLVNHAINNTEIFDGLYEAYAEFTAKQSLSPIKDRLFYFKCASSYLDSPDKYFGVFERVINNNAEKLCYVFYQRNENNYFVDDIIITGYNKMRGSARDFNQAAGLFADYLLSEGDDIKVEMNVLPENFDDNISAMILSLNEKVEDIIEDLKSPVYLNMFMNI